MLKKEKISEKRGIVYAAMDGERLKKETPYNFMITKTIIFKLYLMTK